MNPPSHNRNKGEVPESLKEEIRDLDRCGKVSYHDFIPQLEHVYPAIRNQLDQEWEERLREQRKELIAEGQAEVGKHEARADQHYCDLQEAEVKLGEAEERLKEVERQRDGANEAMDEAEQRCSRWMVRCYEALGKARDLLTALDLYLLQPDCQSTPELLGEGNSSDEEKAVDVLRRFMCCKAGEQFVDEKLLRPFGFALNGWPYVRNLAAATDFDAELEDLASAIRPGGPRPDYDAVADDLNRIATRLKELTPASTQPESPGNSGEEAEAVAITAEERGALVLAVDTAIADQTVSDHMRRVLLGLAARLPFGATQPVPGNSEDPQPLIAPSSEPGNSSEVSQSGNSGGVEGPAQQKEEQ